MRSGRSSRADAITNSPFVRALIKPRLITIPTLLPTSSSSAFSPPKMSDLISTQPIVSSLVVVEGGREKEKEKESEVKLGKRKRVKGDEGEKEEGGEGEGKVVEVNYREENLPVELTKYWAQRYRLFSLFDQGCQLDLEGWYSVTPELVAVQIAERCRSNVIVDAFCGVGGNAIQFAFTCEKVIAIDNSPIRLACARNNARIYGVEDRIQFILADFPLWSLEYLDKKSRGEIKKEDEVEVVFLSPPWGGIDYLDLGSTTSTSTSTPTSNLISTPFKSTKSASNSNPNPTPTPLELIKKQSYPLSAITPIPGISLFKLARQISPHIAYYLPRNTSMEDIAKLTRESPWVRERDQVEEGEAEREEKEEEERVEVEEEWMGRKMKAVTVYFGDLACKREN